MLSVDVNHIGYETLQRDDQAVLDESEGSEKHAYMYSPCRK